MSIDIESLTRACEESGAFKSVWAKIPPDAFKPPWANIPPGAFANPLVTATAATILGDAESRISDAVLGPFTHSLAQAALGAARPQDSAIAEIVRAARSIQPKVDLTAFAKPPVEAFRGPDLAASIRPSVRPEPELLRRLNRTVEAQNEVIARMADDAARSARTEAEHRKRDSKKTAWILALTAIGVLLAGILVLVAI